jgi:hypothetical protein
MRRVCGLSLPSCGSSAEAGEFWVALGNELRSVESRPGQKPMPLLHASITALRGSLLHLYPRSAILLEHLDGLALDPDYIVQMASCGHVDEIADLFPSALGAVLHANCAPKRDELVNHVVDLGRRAAWLSMMIATSELLELMQFDLINYKLCQNRSELLVNFFPRSETYFSALFAQGSLSLNGVKSWILDAKKSSTDGSLNAIDHVLDAFIGLICRPNESLEIPPTLILDHRRIKELRSLFSEVVILGAMMLVISKFVPSIDDHTRAELKTRITKAMANSVTSCEGTLNVADISDQVLLLASRVRGSNRPISTQEKSILGAMIQGAANKGNKVHVIVRTRATAIMRARLLNDTSRSTAPVSNEGLHSISQEVDFVYSKLHLLWARHWRVHGSFYSKLLERG